MLARLDGRHRGAYWACIMPKYPLYHALFRPYRAPAEVVVDLRCTLGAPGLPAVMPPDQRHGVPRLRKYPLDDSPSVGEAKSERPSGHNQQATDAPDPCPGHSVGENEGP